MLWLGPLLCGLAVTAGMTLALPDLRTLRGVLITFAAGAGTGVLFFAPIAGLESFRERLVTPLAPYSFRIQWYTSIGMALSLGYILASTRHETQDGLFVLAWLLVAFGAMIKTALGILFRRYEQNAV